MICLSFASLNFKQGQFTEAGETPLPEDQVAVLFPRFLQDQNFTDGLRDALPELKTKQTFHPSTIKRGIKVDFANFSQQTSPISILPPFINQKKRSGNCPALEKCIKLQQSFPTSLRCLKKLMTKRRSISSRRSSLLSSANSFIQRSYGKGELLTGAPKTPKLQDQNSANETKCVRLHWFSFSKIIRIFGLPKKILMLQKNGNGFFHLQ